MIGGNLAFGIGWWGANQLGSSLGKSCGKILWENLAEKVLMVVMGLKMAKKNTNIGCGKCCGKCCRKCCGKSCGKWLGNDAVFSLNTWLRTIYCLQTIHEPACVILTLFHFFNSVWRFQICGDSPTHGWVYGFGGWVDGRVRSNH